MLAALEGNSMLCRQAVDLLSRRRIHIRNCDLISLSLFLFSLIDHSSKNRVTQAKNCRLTYVPIIVAIFTPFSTSRSPKSSGHWLPVKNT